MPLQVDPGQGYKGGEINKASIPASSSSCLTSLTWCTEQLSIITTDLGTTTILILILVSTLKHTYVVMC